MCVPPNTANMANNTGMKCIHLGVDYTYGIDLGVAEELLIESVL